MPYVIAALAGLLLGALLNVLADDLPRRHTPERPACANCRRIHPPHYWLAVIAYMFGGRCATCGSPIPIRRVLAELTSALALAYLWGRFGATRQFVFNVLIVELLLLITVIDLEHRLILRVVIYPAALVALAAGLVDAARGVERTLIGGAVGFGVTYLFYVFGWLFAKAVGKLRGQPLSEVAFGWGDVNLGGFIGLAVGWPGVTFALLIGVFAGGLGGAFYLAVMRLRGKASAFMAMPYGPFLALGGLVMLLWADEFVAWYFRS